MWCPRLAMLLLFIVAVTGMVDPGVAASARSTRGHHPPLLDCGPAPILSKNDDATFRSNLATALAGLPSVVAAVLPEAFAIVTIGSAVAGGICFSATVPPSPITASACDACLSAAARDITSVCASSGRAGVCRDECFISYADSDAASSREEAFHRWFYAAPSTNATLADGGLCLTDRAVDCDQCLQESARAASALGWWQKIHGEEVVVVGYSCFLRVRISSLPAGPEDGGTVGDLVFVMWLSLVFVASGVALGILFVKIIVLVHALPQVNNG